MEGYNQVKVALVGVRLSLLAHIVGRGFIKVESANGKFGHRFGINVQSANFKTI